MKVVRLSALRTGRLYPQEGYILLNTIQYNKTQASYLHLALIMSRLINFQSASTKHHALPSSEANRRSAGPKVYLSWITKVRYRVQKSAPLVSIWAGPRRGRPGRFNNLAHLKTDINFSGLEQDWPTFLGRAPQKLRITFGETLSCTETRVYSHHNSSDVLTSFIGWRPLSQSWPSPVHARTSHSFKIRVKMVPYPCLDRPCQAVYFLRY
jgi:hypothetical protein